jgi:VCBS repeat-containing protein
MAATTLFAGDAAIVTYNADDGSLTLLFLTPVGAGTRIYLTDRAWNGSAFVGAAGDGVVSLEIGPIDFPAGLAVTLTAAQLAGGGITLSTLGETLYLYQGEGDEPADTPVRFLFALDIGDGDQAFGGSLAGTGLAAGVNAVALAADNAAFAGRLGAIQAAELGAALGDADSWVEDEAHPQPPIPTFALAAHAPDRQLWVAGAGGGDAIVTADADAAATAMIPGTLAYRVLHLLRDDTGGDLLYQPRDIALDTVRGLFFMVDSDADGHNRIVQGSIADLLANPGGPLDLKILYSNDGTGFAGIIHTLSIDPVNGKIYFDENTRVQRIDYDIEGQTPTVLADLSVGPPDYGSFTFINQIAIDYDSGTVYLASSYVDRVGGDDFVPNNRVFTATAGSAAALASAGTNGLVFVPLPFLENDTTFGHPNVPSNGLDHWPKEKGAVVGIDVDPDTDILYIATRTLVLDTSAAQDNSELTTFYGGVFRYDPATATLTELFRQDGSNGPLGTLSYIEADPETGHYYVSDSTGAVFIGSLSAAGTPALYAAVANESGLRPAGLEIQHAPTLTGSDSGAVATEKPGNPSPASPEVQPAASFVSDDADSGDHPTDQLAGAQVRISANFRSGPGHQDLLTIDGSESGDFTSGGGETIAYSYDRATGVLTLSGPATRAAYQEALAAVRFSMEGDNPDDHGTAPSRTVSYSVFDGLLYADEVDAEVAVATVNDLPAIDLNGDAAGTSSSIDFEENDPPTAVAPEATVEDPDSTFEAGTLTVAFSSGGTLDDQLRVVNQGVGPGQFLVDESDLYFQNVLVGAIVGGSDGSTPLLVTFNANASPAVAQALVRAIGYVNFSGNPAPGERTLTFTLADGEGGTSNVATATVTVEAANDPPVAQPDNVSTPENEVGTGSVFADNGFGNDIDPDGDSLIVSEVNDDPDNVDREILLASGAKLTVNADGSYRYDPNGQFTELASDGSGAVNTSATDTFTYTIAGGNTVTVTVTILGVSGPGSRLEGDQNDNVITGTPEPDFFFVVQGGNDDLTGLGSDDVFFFGPALTSADKANGNGGTDQIALQGDYSGAGALTLGTGILSVESLAILPGNDIRFGDPGTEFYDYDIATRDANVAPGAQMVVDANRLREDEDFTFDGSAESDGSFFIYGGGGIDLLTGGAKNDVFLFGAQGQWGPDDRLVGGAGLNQLALRGNYTIVFGPDQLIGIENIGLLSAHDTRFGPLGDNYGYDLTMDDANVAPGVRMTVDGFKLRPTETLYFDGSAETDGSFRVFGGQCHDWIAGGSGKDILVGGFGGDMLFGGDGDDTFVYRSTGDSTAESPDIIADFAVGDLIDLAKIDAIQGPGDEAFTFIGPGTFSGQAGELRAEQQDGPAWLIQGDTDGDGAADFEFFVVVTDSDPITAVDFIL